MPPASPSGMNRPHSSPIPESMYDQPTRKPRTGMWVLLAVLLIGAVVAFVLGFTSGDDEEASPTTASGSVVETSEAGGGASGGGSGASSTGPFVVGDAVALEGGVLARVTTVLPDAPPLDDFFGPDEGYSLTRVVVEMCAGSEMLTVNPLYWTAFDDQDVEVASSIFDEDLVAVDVAPGGCVSGSISFEVRDGTTLASVVLTDQVLVEIARWDATSPATVDGPLQPSVSPTALGPDEVATIENGGTAELVSLVMDVPRDDAFGDLPEGWFVAELSVRMCAGSETLMVNPEYWFLVTTDNYMAGSSMNSGSLGFLNIAPGECAAGTMTMDLPPGSEEAYIVLTDVIYEEMARWSVG